MNIDQTLKDVEYGLSHLEDDKHFTRTVQSVDIDIGVIAETLGVSRPTAKRWIAGTTRPLPPMRKPVYSGLRTLCLIKRHVATYNEGESLTGNFVNALEPFVLELLHPHTPERRRLLSYDLKESLTKLALFIRGEE